MAYKENFPMGIYLSWGKCYSKEFKATPLVSSFFLKNFTSILFILSWTSE